VDALVEKFTKRMLGASVHELWDLREQGLTAEEIAARTRWSVTGVRQHFRRHGGVRPRWGRNLAGRSLSFEERQSIMVLKAQKVPIRQIAAQLGRAPSTISRELARNTSEWGKYRATTAQARAFDRGRRPKPVKLVVNARLRAEVQAQLVLKRSPEQIVGRLRRQFPNDPEMQVSHETIYQAIYLLARGGLKRDLEQVLRTGRTLRKPDRRPAERRGRIPGMVLIADRPAEAADRAIPGHWEGDLIVGKDGASAIGTIVERRSGYLLLLHLPAGINRVDAVTDALTARLRDLPDLLRRTLTWDQGIELHRHRQVQLDADIDIYFCDPRSPWQRPTNENTNGLLRQYFPKSTDLSVFSPEDLAYVEWEMNDRPRKRLDFAKPSEIIETILLP
jgi:transposase, IS30 family